MSRGILKIFFQTDEILIKKCNFVGMLNNPVETVRDALAEKSAVKVLRETEQFG